MKKSREAFRTISEVADWLDVPAHVLRFWETRFAQIKPTKRAGGRRYYRPADMLVIGGIKTLLRDKGMTIRGVQKLLREQGVSHVSSFSIPLDSERTEREAQDQIESVAKDVRQIPSPIVPDRSAADIGLNETDADSTGSQAQEEAGAAEVRLPDAETATGREGSGVPASATASQADADLQPARDADREIDPSEAAEADPEDDAEEFARGPGIAARVLLADPARLKAHRDDLLKAAERLKALSLGRAGNS
ncbi:MAG: MerR family transcriptional regulator [Boseongicola sp. SB0662_bin_57]|nr:MerR family transcriptional regulator [Boseongicola sp. SB0662_bin_57]